MQRVLSVGKCVLMFGLLLLIFSILGTSVAAAKSLKEAFDGEVIEVDSENIQAFLSESKHEFLLEFYAPWCGHCTNFESSYKEIAREYHSEKGSFYVGRVDISNNDALSGRFDVSHIPCLFLNTGENLKQLYSYDGGQMSKSAVKHWVAKGHKKFIPIHYFASPMGPLGNMKGAFIESGVRLQNFAKSISDKYDIPLTWGFIILAAVFGVIILVATLACAFAMVPHDKSD